MNHITFLLFICVCSLSFYSCTSTKQQKSVKIAPLPVINKKFKNLKIRKEQAQKLIEIEKLFLKKQFKKALNVGTSIVETNGTLDQYRKALEWIGDIFNARGEKTDSFHFYNECLNYEISKSETKALIDKIISVTSSMATQKSIPLIFQIKKPFIRGQVLFKTGLKKIESRNEEDALSLLKIFIKKFSAHKDRWQAETILKNIKLAEEEREFKKTAIGVLLPLSGYFRMAGNRVLDAIYLAVSKFNNNEFNNIEQLHSFNLYVEDTASDPEVAADAVKRLEQKNVACIIGPMITVHSAAIESNNLGIPIIVLSQKSNVTEIGPFVLRNYITPAMQISAGISYFQEKYGSPNFAMLYPNEKYGMVFKDAFLDAITKYDANMTEMISYDTSQTDFSYQIKQFITGYQKLDKNGEYVDMEYGEKKEKNKIYLAKVDFDVLFIPDSAGMVNMIAPQLQYNGIEVDLMGTNLWNSKKTPLVTDYVQGAIFPDGFYPESKLTKIANFISSYSEITGSFPGYSETIAYDTATIVMNALSSAAVTSREEMVTYLQSNIFENIITCPTSFDTQGEPVKTLQLFQVKDKNIRLIESCDN